MSRDGEKKSRGRFGAFFGGGFLGFNLCLALIFGTLAFVYFKVSPNWINKTFKTEISLGEELNDKTLKDLVSVVSGVMQNADNYTLSDLKGDFGYEVKDELFGINIADLKNVPIKKLASATEEKFANISADELRNVSGMNLEESMGKILNKSNTYYYKDEKLFKNYNAGVHSNEVKFKFDLNEGKNKVIVKNHEFDIVDGKVEIELWYLPLTSGISDFTSNMGENITLYDLEKDYGVKLPSFFKLTDEKKKETSVNELEVTINDLYIKDILGVNIKYDNDNKTYYDDKDNDNVNDADEEIAYVLKAIAETQVKNLDTLINDFTLSQIFTENELKVGVLSLLDNNTKIKDIPSEIDKVIKKTNMQMLIDKGIIVEPAKYSTLKTKQTTILRQDMSGYKTVEELFIPEMIDYCFELIKLVEDLQNSLP